MNRTQVIVKNFIFDKSPSSLKYNCLFIPKLFLITPQRTGIPVCGNLFPKIQEFKETI